ncbi:type VII secretion target [Gordonia rhizosphera]|uniref:type VII secretion target n=1 Tax=Gordonia rhizosphera TaxID=83341 RepID=UPI0002E2E75A|nr:type VII secretion target [Gordonia rhizosphera]
MDIDPPVVRRIAQGWRQTAEDLDAASRRAADHSGDWAPAVSAAVADFAVAWGTDLARLARRAEAMAEAAAGAAAVYAATDDDLGVVPELARHPDADDGTDSRHGQVDRRPDAV